MCTLREWGTTLSSNAAVFLAIKALFPSLFQGSYASKKSGKMGPKGTTNKDDLSLMHYSFITPISRASKQASSLLACECKPDVKFAPNSHDIR